MFAYLPRSARRDVLDDHPVVGLGTGWVSPPAAVAATSEATAVTVPVAPVPGVSGKLDSDASALKVLSVHVLNCVVRIPGDKEKILDHGGSKNICTSSNSLCLLLLNP